MIEGAGVGGSTEPTGSRINLVGPFNGSGYGITTLQILKALERAGHEVTFFPTLVRDGPDFELEWADVALVAQCRRRWPTFDVTAPCLRISTEYDMTLFAGVGTRCGLSFFETTCFTDAELRQLRTLDMLFVATTWARTVAIDNGFAADSVELVPLGVDRRVFADAPPRADGPTIFVNIGKWERRKGQDVLLDAFERAFRPGDAVELQLMCQNPWSALGDERWVQRCRSSPMAAHITVLPRRLRHEEVAEVIRAADCGVFPYRAEAWNLGLLEMLSCGRHVIATDYSGPTDFLDHENAMLLTVDALEPVSDPEWMTIYTEHKRGDWAHLGEQQIEQLVHHLRAVHDRKQHGALGLNVAGIETAERHPWSRSARCVVDGIAALGR